MRQCDFSGKRIDEALRILLESFRLPGESQQIERVMNSFASVYFASNPTDVANEDAAFILAYSIIMLNTDLVRALLWCGGAAPPSACPSAHR